MPDQVVESSNHGLPEITTEQEARAIMAGGLGRAELEFVASITAPLYWVIQENDNQVRVRNGSAFFLDAGQGPFCVTADHVIKGWREDSKKFDVGALHLWDSLPLDFEGKNALIASHSDLDIATFRVSKEEIASIRKTILTGSQSVWPPKPPQEERGIYFSGFPGCETLRESPYETCFGAVSGGGVANSISKTDISSLIEREELMDLMGKGIIPENYDFRGISGGPMLSVIENRGMRSWALAGVIYQGPNTENDANQAIRGLELIKARRAHYILPDGTLDIPRWDRAC